MQVYIVEASEAFRFECYCVLEFCEEGIFPRKWHRLITSVLFSNDIVS